MPSLLAQIDPGAVATIVFLAIGFISWIVNAAGGNKANPPRPPVRDRGQAPQRPRGQGGGRAAGELQNEIESFLEEVTGTRQPQRDRAEEVVQADTDDAGKEQRGERGRRKRAARRPERTRERRRSRPSGGRPKPKPKAPEPVAPGQGSRPVGSSDLGAGLRDHVAEYMDDRIEQGVDDHITSSVSHSVAQHLGDRIGPAQTGAAAPGTAGEIVKLLRDPAGVRQAILVSEILSRPKSLR